MCWFDRPSFAYFLCNHYRISTICGQENEWIDFYRTLFSILLYGMKSILRRGKQLVITLGNFDNCIETSQPTSLNFTWSLNMWMVCHNPKWKLGISSFSVSPRLLALIELAAEKRERIQSPCEIAVAYDAGFWIRTNTTEYLR